MQSFGSRLHDFLKVPRSNNVGIQCGCVFLLIWKIMLLDFFGSKFCKNYERTLACFHLRAILKNSSYVSGVSVCIFVALYVQMFVARANKVEGTIS